MSISDDSSPRRCALTARSWPEVVAYAGGADDGGLMRWVDVSTGDGPENITRYVTEGCVRQDTSAVAADAESLRARIAELHECLTKCAESAYEAGVADERERCAALCEQHIDTALGYVLGPDCAKLIRGA